MARRVKRVRQARRKAKKNISATHPPLCPECGGAEVIPVVHGPITPPLQHSIQQGRAILADREEWEGMSEWYCKACGCDWSGNWRRFKKSGGVNATRA